MSGEEAHSRSMDPDRSALHGGDALEAMLVGKEDQWFSLSVFSKV
jgi:hypothetical protein